MTKENENEEVKNPFIDNAYKGNWKVLKDVAEKTIADKVHTRIKNRKEEIMDEITGR